MRRQLRGLVLLLACLSSTCQAKPLSVPSGGPKVTDLAEFDTLYPNPKITSKLCQYEPKGKANVVAVHQHHVATKVPDHNVFIELAMGRNPLNRDGSSGTIVDVNNPSDFVSMLTTESVFCGATTHTNDGRMIQVGGHAPRNVTVSKTETLYYTEGLGGIRILDPRNDNHLKRVATMSAWRWYPSVHLLADGNVIISGGSWDAGNRYKGVPTAEIFNPRSTHTPSRVIDLPQPYLESFENKPWYPFMWQMPTGHVFMFADSNSCILNHHTGKCVTDNNGNLVSPPPRPGGVASTYPFTGSAVLAKLEPNADNTISSMDIIVFGGTKRSDHPNHTKNWGSGGYNPTARASRLSHRITISWTRDDDSSPWQFKFSGWVEEDMGYPRVMPDAPMLPNGDVVITNGCQAGVAGYANGNVSISQYPAFWASLYQPDRPANKRYTLLCGTQQPRGYHGSASLTTEGKIVIAGHDRPRWYLPMPNVPWFKDGTGGKVAPAYNIEMFHPPYVYDTANKPEITSVNGKPVASPRTLKYNSRFTVMYGPAPGASDVTVTSVTLVAPTSVTHQNNMNQRVIQLNFKEVSPGKLHVYTPFHPYYAVPQYYMLFLNNVKTYSTAAWVRLVDTKHVGLEAPNP